MATLKDIADHCDLSISLVSKVLNNRMGTSSAKPEVVKSIRDAAKELGYRKNLSAEALRSGRHNVIGVLMHHFGRPGTGLTESMLQGISRACGQYHQSQTLTFYHNEAEFRAAAWAYHPGTMDGVLVTGLHHTELIEDLNLMRRGGFPMVSIHSEAILGDEVPNVGIDEAKLTRMATEHLLHKGCQHLIYVGSMDVRTPGFIHAMRDAGKPVSDQQIIHSLLTFESGQQAVAQIIDRHLQYDGIVVDCDETASGVMSALLARQIKIPQDVRIIGIDNSPYCQFLPVTLSSVCQRPMERGELAVSLLNQLINGQTDTHAHIYEPMLYERQSTA